MAKAKETGITQKSNGLWEYRFVMVVNGQRINKKKSTDEFGNKLRTKKEAIKAREAAMSKARGECESKPEITRKTFKEVYDEYCAKGRSGKAYATIVKQDSLWKNHICKAFGNRYVDEVSVAEINDYLTDLYYISNYSYKYVESFLKVFYLIFGQAYSRDYLAIDTYNKLCLNKSTKISMPPLKVDDDIDIVAFSREELVLLDEYFKGTNAETAYMLGRYCGLRINESYGLKWENVDLDGGTIFIDRQQQYQNGLVKLVAPKTRNAKRTIFLCDKIRTHLNEKWKQEQQNRIEYAAVRRQKQRMIDDIDGKVISSTDLVNCLPDGTIQTINSMKFHSKAIKQKLGIQFKYHYLRHTYGTLLADMNTPQHLLCNQMGHGNINVTQLYYLAISKTGIEALQKNINQL